MTEDDLDKPIQLDDAVLAQLSDDVRDRLQRVTFKHIMTHHSGLMDYMAQQEAAIKEAKQQGKPIPTVNSSQALLKYADKKVSENFGDEKVGELSTKHYSNLGILLVGCID